MLTITPTAASVLSQARNEKGAPDDSGVRFYATTPEGSDRARLAFTFVQSPEDGDAVVSRDPIEAYVASDVEELIGNATIDAKRDGDAVGLVVRRD